MTLVSVFKPVNQLDELFKDVLKQRTENSYVHDGMGIGINECAPSFSFRQITLIRFIRMAKVVLVSFFFWGVLDCFQHLALRGRAGSKQSHPLVQAAGQSVDAIGTVTSFPYML